jgi:tRNA(Ile)-lysidine synthase
MIRFEKRLVDKSKHVHVACSGGVDSMAVCDFLKRGGFNVRPVFFNHGTETSRAAEIFLENYFTVGFTKGKLYGEKPKDKSWEEYWRDERYKFFNSLGLETIVTAHHLDDCVESYVFSALHGNAKLPMVHRRLGRSIVVRPFMMTSKSDLVAWAKQHNVPWMEDASNFDVSVGTRNYVRHALMPGILRVNPGISKVVAKKVRELYLTSLAK